MFALRLMTSLRFLTLQVAAESQNTKNLVC